MRGRAIGQRIRRIHDAFAARARGIVLTNADRAGAWRAILRGNREATMQWVTYLHSAWVAVRNTFTVVRGDLAKVALALVHGTAVAVIAVAIRRAGLTARMFGQFYVLVKGG